VDDLLRAWLRVLDVSGRDAEKGEPAYRRVESVEV
jgi:hypothetical protein